MNVPEVPNARGLSDALAQVVQAAASHATAVLDLDGRQTWAVQREDTLNADTVGELTDGEGGTDAVVVPGDAGSLEDLDTLLLALANTDVDAKGVASPELRDVLSRLKAVEIFDDADGADGALPASVYRSPSKRSKMMDTAERTER